jgi:2-polyprenyl-3-methyl-5-hydroxy-6-metoxy-1,4-benzoquinol methylase
MPTITNKDIITHLSSLTTGAGFVDTLKIKYRPIICPFDTLLSYVGNATSVFDIGCGSGQFCSLIAAFTGATNIAGVEINDRLVNNAKELNPSTAHKTMSFYTFNGVNLPAQFSTYDVVFLIDVLHHVPLQQQTSFMQEIYTKMKPGAQLIFKDINAASPLVYCNKLHDLIFAQEIGNELKYSAALDLCKNLGFTITETYTRTSFVYPHYFIIAQK